MLRVGFDFDGVIAYNPLRVLRLPLNFASGFLFRKKIVNYYPSNRLSQLLWKAAHKFSLFPAKGFAELRKLMADGRIEGYLISGRYALLEDDLRFWLSKHQADKLFKGCYVNSADDPPHQFKEKMIRKLKLDYFVEDNWDIVNYLNSSLGNSGSTPNHSLRSGTGHGFKVQGSKLNSTPNQNKFGLGLPGTELRSGTVARFPPQAATTKPRINPTLSRMVQGRQCSNVKIHWIYNIVDRFKPYPQKHSDLQHFLKTLLASKGDSF